VLGDLPSGFAKALFSKAREVALKADHSLFLQGDEGNGCYRVEEGLLKASVRAPKGNERILAIFGPGAVIGELAILDGRVRSASVIALRDSKLSFVSRAAFEAFARESPELYRHLVILLARRLRETNDALTATNFLSVKVQKVSQNDLAAMAGVARENVTRVLTDWTNRSWLSRLAGHYCLENKNAIQHEVS
jgi:CRP/FNR family cyclic AMP-dependent transcriptional regulator